MFFNDRKPRIYRKISNDKTTDPIHSMTNSLLKMIEKKGSKILNYSVQMNAVTAGYNFCSGIVKLAIRFQQSSGAVEDGSYILKIPAHCPFYHQLSALNMYKNEKLMYSSIFPAMSEFADCAWVANCYLLPEGDNLVFDDLSVYEYTLMDKTQQLDSAHSELAITTLAKFHALSVKLQEVSTEVAEMIQVPARETPKINPPPSALLVKFESTLEMLDLPQHVKQKVHQFVQSDGVRSFNKTMIRNEHFNVLCHGDFWLGNMLFKHDHEGNVEDLKLLDYQMAHWCSPVIDLIKFFITSVKFDVYENNRDELISSYLETFNGTLELLGSPARYGWDDLDRDMREYKQYFLYCLGYYLSSILSEESPFNHQQDDVKYYSSPLYSDTLSKWLEHLNDKGML